ncbi:hypothetical protein ACKLNO_02000 [Neisseriaceae bacterium B1]
MKKYWILSLGLLLNGCQLAPKAAPNTPPPTPYATIQAAHDYGKALCHQAFTPSDEVTADPAENFQLYARRYFGCTQNPIYPDLRDTSAALAYIRHLADNHYPPAQDFIQREQAWRQVYPAVFQAACEQNDQEKLRVLRFVLPVSSEITELPESRYAAQMAMYYGCDVVVDPLFAIKNLQQLAQEGFIPAQQFLQNETKWTKTP